MYFPSELYWTETDSYRYQMEKQGYLSGTATATVLVTVAACTFGAYLIWKQGASQQSNSPSQVTVTNETGRGTDVCTVEEKQPNSCKVSITNSGSPGNNELQSLSEVPMKTEENYVHNVIQDRMVENNLCRNGDISEITDHNFNTSIPGIPHKLEGSMMTEEVKIDSEETVTGNPEVPMVADEPTPSKSPPLKDLFQNSQYKIETSLICTHNELDPDITINTGQEVCHLAPENNNKDQEVSLIDGFHKYNFENETSLTCTSNELGPNIIINAGRKLCHLSPDENKGQEISNVSDLQTVCNYLGNINHFEEAEFNRIIYNIGISGRNPIHRAVMEGNTAVVKSLLRLGASVDFCDRQGRYPIHQAASTGNIELLSILARWGGDLTRKDMRGYTLLHWAALTGQTETVQWLIDRGAQIEAVNCAGLTPLHLAAMVGHRQTSELLINCGAQVNIKDKDGWTPLYLAKIFKQKDVVELLVSKGGICRINEIKLNKW